MAKKLLGRPTDFTPETVKKLEEAFSIDASVEEACFYADISRQTFYDWSKKNKAFSDRIEALRQRPVLLARQTVAKKLAESYSNAIDYLKRKKRLEFGDSMNIDASVKIEVTIEEKEAVSKALDAI